MNRRQHIPRLQSDEIAVVHAVWLKPPTCAQNTIFPIRIAVRNLQIALPAVQLDGNGVEIVVVPLLHDLDVDRMSVQHWPCAVKIVLKNTALPVRIDIRITAEVENHILLRAEIEQIAANRREHVHLSRTEPHKCTAVTINILQCGGIEELLPLRGQRVEPPRSALPREEFRRLVGQLPIEHDVEQTFLLHQCRILIDVRRKSVLIPIIGIVGGNAAAAPTVVAVHLVNTGIVHRRCKCLGTWKLLCRLLRQSRQIDHICIAHLTRIAAVVLRTLRCTIQCRKKGGREMCRTRQHIAAVRLIGGTELRQTTKVNDRKRRLLLRILLPASCKIGVTDHLTQPCAAHRRIVAECPDPRIIVPAVARLHLLRGDHIARVALKRCRRLVARHQTGIKADEFIGRLCGSFTVDSRERLPYIIETQHILRTLIRTDTRSAPAAMIPKHKDTVIGGIVLRAIAQEIYERPHASHIGIRQVLKFMQTVRIIEIEIERLRKRIVLPLLRAARKDQHTHVGGQIRFHHLLNIRTRRAMLRLEIRAADIPR